MASQTQSFAASVTGTANTAVNWSITPSTSGSISIEGRYTAPATVTSTQTVIVKATSLADPTKFATADVKVFPPPPAPPTANPQTVSVPFNLATPIILSGSDPHALPLTYSTVSV